ncbi:MAG: DNA internalization-related competence protein ComEC/Rec2 [Myxococcota bacterium]
MRAPPSAIGLGIVGIWVGCAQFDPLPVPLALLALGLGVGVLAWRRSMPAALAMVVLGLGAAVAGLSLPTPRSPQPGAVLSDAGIRILRQSGRDPARFDLEIHSPEHRFFARGRVPQARVGDELTGTVAIRYPRRFRNPSPAFTPPTASPTEVKITRPHTVRHAPSMLQGLRHHIRRRLEGTLEPRAAAVATALVLGDGAAVDIADQERFRDAGLAHLLAVSGLHVALFAGLIVALVRWVVPKIFRAGEVNALRVAAAVGIPFAVGYATLTTTPSAWRAAVTASLGWGLIALGRRGSPLSVLSVAALLLGAADPTLLRRPAFLLSVLATAAIVSQPSRSSSIADLEDHPVRDSARALVVLSGRIVVATAPLVYILFGSIPWAGFVANVLLVPLAAVTLVPLALLHALVASGLPPLAVVTAPPFEWSVHALVGAADAFQALQLNPELVPPTPVQAVAVCIACFGGVFAPSFRSKATMIAAGCLLFAAAEGHLQWKEGQAGLRVTFADVGQGDAAIVDLPNGKLMLIDAGGALRSGPDPGADTLLPLLRARRRHRVDIAVVTHAHPDHYLGFEAIVRALPVGELWDSEQATVERPGESYDRFRRRLRAEGVTVRTPDELCTPRREGATTLRVLWPCPSYDAGYDANDNSLVLRLDHDGIGWLFVGDIEEPAERALLGQELPLRADVLKVAHHGSRTSSGQAFLDAVRPHIAVISAGQGNRYRHPHPEIDQRLRSGGATVLRTDRDGGVVVERSAVGLEFRTAAGRRGDVRLPSRPKREATFWIPP